MKLASIIVSLVVGAFVGAVGTITIDSYAAKWKPNIPDAKQIIAREARDEDNKVSWQVEMRRGSEWPDLYTASPGNLHKLCGRFDKP